MAGVAQGSEQALSQSRLNDDVLTIAAVDQHVME